MFLYLFITWSFGAGLAHTFKEQDKKSGKKFKLFSTIVFIGLTPLVLPVILGMMIGDYLEEKD